MPHIKIYQCQNHLIGYQHKIDKIDDAQISSGQVREPYYISSQEGRSTASGPP
ncbi:hypothetical protein EYZ11_012683 [Aspergillus tanneri]|uniref:Uncharacterized protein n=1 Tax=Aspergillus tanneri TaxID=1220188 RepID=A0A4S3J051_9EURO|nr:hypothetical protein EYZ11_012683 [Aspergillus tanneri]